MLTNRKYRGYRRRENTEDTDGQWIRETVDIVDTDREWIQRIPADSGYRESVDI